MLVTQSEAARLLGVSRRSLDRKKELLEAQGQAQRMGARLLYETEGLKQAFNSISELQVANAERMEAEAHQEAEADAAAGKIPPYAESRAKREHYLALLAQRQLEQLEGTLVNKEQFNRMVFQEARSCRDQLLNLAARIAPDLHAQKTTADVAIRLEAAIHQALLDFSNGLERTVGGDPDEQ